MRFGGGKGTDGVGWSWTVVVRVVPSKLGKVELAREAGHAALRSLICLVGRAREELGRAGCRASQGAFPSSGGPKRTPNRIPRSWDLEFHAFFPNPARSTLRPTLTPSVGNETMVQTVERFQLPYCKVHPLCTLSLLFASFGPSSVVVVDACISFAQSDRWLKGELFQDLEKGNNDVPSSRQNRQSSGLDTSTAIVEGSSFLMKRGQEGTDQVPSKAGYGSDRIGSGSASGLEGTAGKKVRRNLSFERRAKTRRRLL